MTKAERALREFETWMHWPTWVRAAVDNDITVRFGWRDRLLILIGRPVAITTRTLTSQPVGRTEGRARVRIVGIRWPWSRPSFGVADVASMPEPLEI